MNKLHKKDFFLWSINTALEAHAHNNLAIIGTSYCEQQVFMKKLTLTSVYSPCPPSFFPVYLFIYLFFDHSFPFGLFPFIPAADPLDPCKVFLQ